MEEIVVSHCDVSPLPFFSLTLLWFIFVPCLVGLSRSDVKVLGSKASLYCHELLANSNSGTDRSWNAFRVHEMFYCASVDINRGFIRKNAFTPLFGIGGVLFIPQLKDELYSQHPVAFLCESPDIGCCEVTLDLGQHTRSHPSPLPRETRTIAKCSAKWVELKIFPGHRRRFKAGQCLDQRW
ncbi:hypothetical protein NPIL_489041 [Nephila pilipes]|uniref:Uncharacterized protein n=1 Tax=Nephila pilipes TaxID=299642 RepID=A0A8X6MSL4_NEPPI|nr:hypothetical protein NPIL_489041 [Nephila pilipes]